MVPQRTPLRRGFPDCDSQPARRSPPAPSPRLCELVVENSVCSPQRTQGPQRKWSGCAIHPRFQAFLCALRVLRGNLHREWHHEGHEEPRRRKPRFAPRWRSPILGSVGSVSSVVENGVCSPQRTQGHRETGQAAPDTPGFKPSFVLFASFVVTPIGNGTTKVTKSHEGGNHGSAN